ncbi:MAG: LVIVD repeat-containing protein [Candidatus Heimdallarchaeota archaeon]
MLKGKIHQYTKKLSFLLIILIIFLPNFFTCAIGRNANQNNSNSINNIGAPSYYYKDIVVRDDLVILSSYSNFWEIWDTSNPKKPFLVKTIHFVSEDPEYLFDIEITDDYLFIKSSDKIIIYDLADPTNPNSITSISCSFSNVVEIHFENNFLYLLQYVDHTSYFTSALAILNISDFNSIQLIGVYNSSIHHVNFDWFLEYDRLLIKNNFVYLVCSGDFYPVDVDPVLEIIDISNKSNPQKQGEFVLPSKPYSIGLRDNFAFIPTRYDCLQIIDCSNPSAPINVSKFERTELISDIEIRNNVAYLALATKLVILDITDIENIVTLGEYTLRNQGNTYFHSLKVHGDILYTIGPSEHYDRYFFIFDCSDLTDPTRLYPKGIRISSEILFNLTIFATYAGIILGPIIVIIGLFFLVKKLKQRRLRVNQNEQKN